MFAFSSVAGGAVSRVDPDSTGVNPSWRTAISHITAGVSWDEGSTADYITQQIDLLKQKTLILDQLATDSGSYYNEVRKEGFPFFYFYFATSSKLTPISVCVWPS